VVACSVLPAFAGHAQPALGVGLPHRRSWAKRPSHFMEALQAGCCVCGFFQGIAQRPGPIRPAGSWRKLELNVPSPGLPPQIFGVFGPLAHHIAPLPLLLPVSIAAAPPLAQVLLTDRDSAEALVAQSLRLGQRVEPIQHRLGPARRRQVGGSTAPGFSSGEPGRSPGHSRVRAAGGPWSARISRRAGRDSTLLMCSWWYLPCERCVDQPGIFMVWDLIILVKSARREKRW